jgi:hypothetical protein
VGTDTDALRIMLSMHACAHHISVPIAIVYMDGSVLDVQAEARHTAAVTSARLAGQHHPHAAAALQLIISGVQALAT